MNISNTGLTTPVKPITNTTTKPVENTSQTKRQEELSGVNIIISDEYKAWAKNLKNSQVDAIQASYFAPLIVGRFPFTFKKTSSLLDKDE
jgi:hypothetical protein